jgi:hypothetical protein
MKNSETKEETWKTIKKNKETRKTVKLRIKGGIIRRK